MFVFLSARLFLYVTIFVSARPCSSHFSPLVFSFFAGCVFLGVPYSRCSYGSDFLAAVILHVLGCARIVLYRNLNVSASHLDNMQQDMGWEAKPGGQVHHALAKRSMRSQRQLVGPRGGGKDGQHEKYRAGQVIAYSNYAPPRYCPKKTTTEQLGIPWENTTNPRKKLDKPKKTTYKNQQYCHPPAVTCPDRQDYSIGKFVGPKAKAWKQSRTVHFPSSQRSSSSSSLLPSVPCS